MVKDLLEQAYPSLTRGSYEIRSPEDNSYNCVAWAAEDISRWWWPDFLQIAYWPETVPRVETPAAFVQTFNLIGYMVCETPDYERCYEKIAIYSRDATLTHVAKQLANGRWTSKLGESVDIEHDTLSGLRDLYGEPIIFLKRPRANRLSRILLALAKWLKRIPPTTVYQ